CATLSANAADSRFTPLPAVNAVCPAPGHDRELNRLPAFRRSERREPSSEPPFRHPQLISPTRPGRRASLAIPAAAPYVSCADGCESGFAAFGHPATPWFRAGTVAALRSLRLTQRRRKRGDRRPLRTSGDWLRRQNRSAREETAVAPQRVA